jgi:hypothetical protein
MLCRRGLKAKSPGPSNYFPYGEPHWATRSSRPSRLDSPPSQVAGPSPVPLAPSSARCTWTRRRSAAPIALPRATQAASRWTGRGQGPRRARSLRSAPNVRPRVATSRPKELGYRCRADAPAGGIPCRRLGRLPCRGCGCSDTPPVAAARLRLARPAPATPRRSEVLVRRPRRPSPIGSPRRRCASPRRSRSPVRIGARCNGHQKDASYVKLVRLHD